MSNESTADWNPLSLAEVSRLFADATFPWWIVGGFAVELAVERTLRPHGDIDVLVLRKDVHSLRQFLADWDCWTSDVHGQFGPWKVGDALPDRAHYIWCRKETTGPWRLDIKVDEGTGSTWHSRRDSGVSLPLAEFGALDREGIPYVTPEVLIYYKAKAPRPRDEIDLEAILPQLGAKQRDWAADAIRTSYGGTHPWLAWLGPEASRPGDTFLKIDAPVGNRELNALFASAWPGHQEMDFSRVLQRALTYVCAYEGERLVGFVKVVGDDGVHGFVLDPTVAADCQRKGIGRRLVQACTEEARRHRVEWLHVDFEPQYRRFYEACGFSATEGGLLRLKSK